MRAAATPIQIFALRERVESLRKAKPKAATNAMMALLLRVRRRVAPRKRAGHAQAVLLRARWPASSVAMEKRKPSALGWRKSSSPRRRSWVAGGEQGMIAPRQGPESSPFRVAAGEFLWGRSRRRDRVVSIAGTR